MKHPNKLDWLIYRIFRWWWNPIFRENHNLTTGLILDLGKFTGHHFEPWKGYTSWEK